MTCNITYLTPDICAGYIASAGLSGNVNWEFTVCAGTQFSLVVYELEPLILCNSYSYKVFANGVTVIGPNTSGTPPKASTPIIKNNSGPFALPDVKIKKVKRKIKTTSLP